MWECDSKIENGTKLASKMHIQLWVTWNTKVLYQFRMALFRCCLGVGGMVSCKWFFLVAFPPLHKSHTLYRNAKDILSICKHLQYFSIEYDLLFSLFFSGKYAAAAFEINLQQCLRQFYCYSSDLFAVYFCNVSILELRLFTFIPPLLSSHENHCMSNL